MNEKDLLIALLSTLRGSVNVPVKTRGSETGIDLPGVVVQDFDSNRDQFWTGARPYVGPNTDVNGVEVSREYHFVFNANVDILVRSLDEVERDDLLQQIKNAFQLLEDDPARFHQHVNQISVGGSDRRTVDGQDPTWYEGTVTVGFRYVQMLTQSADALSTVQENVDPTYDSPN